MKTPIVLTAILSLIVSTTLPAHAMAPRAYIDASPNFWSGAPKVMIDGKAYRMRAFVPGYKLSDAVGSNRRAKDLAEKHEAYALWAGISTGVALAGALTYLFTTDSDDYESGTYFTILLVGLLPSIVLQKTSLAYLHKSINAYNGIDDRYDSGIQLNIIPVKEGATAALTYSF